MTLDFYELNEQPFAASPDPKFLYMSSTHQQVFASLLRSLQANRAVVTLLAEPGLGKTTLLLHALKSFGDRVATVFLDQAAQTPVDLLRTILADLGVREIQDELKDMRSQLEKLLTEEHRLGKRVIVVVDQAQDLDASVFDLLCMLSALQTPRGSLIHFILCGQPPLTTKLAAIKPTQWMQRVTPLAHLEPFSAADTAQYVDHRLRIAGYSRQLPLFTPEAAALVARFTGGNPRTINRLCFEVLATAYRRRREQIGHDIVREVAGDLDLARPRQQSAFAAPLYAPAATSVALERPSVSLAPQPARPNPSSRTESSAPLLAASALSPHVEAAQISTPLERSAPEAREEPKRLQEQLVQEPFEKVPCLPVSADKEISGTLAEPPPAAPAGEYAVAAAQPAAPLQTASEEVGEITPHALSAPRMAQGPKPAQEESLPGPVSPVAAPKMVPPQPAQRAPAVVNPGRAARPLISSTAPKAEKRATVTKKQPVTPPRQAPVPLIAATGRTGRPVRPSPLAAPQLQARNRGAFAARPSTLRPLPGLAITAVLLLAIAGAALTTYRAKMPALAKGQIVAGLPRLPHPAPLVQDHVARMVTPARPKAASATTHPGQHAKREPFNKEHDLKGMDLQAALRALSLETHSR